MPKLLPHQYSTIVSDYLSGMSQEQVAIKNNVGDESVGKIVRRFGHNTRKYTGDRTSNRNWEWKYDFFDSHNDKSSYWAGFLFADGNINDGGNVMACMIHKKDKAHIEAFCRDIGLDVNAIYEQENVVGVHLHYKKLGEQLNGWGIVPRKSKHFQHPDIETHLLPHFLRGWIDGDGSVYRYGRSSRITVSSGNIDSLKWFYGALRKISYFGNIGIRQTTSSKYPDNYILYIGGSKQVSEVCKLLVVDNFFCMRRKWDSHYKEKRKKVHRLCEICGGAFEIDSFRAKNEDTNGRFCSRNCFYLYLKSQPRSFSNPTLIQK